MKKINKHKLTAVFMACLLIAGMGVSLPATMGAESLVLTAKAEEAEHTEGTYKGLNYKNYGTDVMITGCDKSIEIAEIPAEIEGVPVTDIKERVFADCKNLTSVTIPESVTYIGDHAFSGCESLTSVTIPDSVTYVGDYAFEYCKSLSSVIIGNSVERIGIRAFTYCYSLTSVIIGNSVTTIKGGAFYDCEALTSITIPESLTYVEESAFYHTAWLEERKKENPFVVVNGILIDTATIRRENIVIPDNVVIIEESSLKNCTRMRSVIIPDGVTTIRVSAFEGCEHLDDVTIPKSVTHIEKLAFYGSSYLRDVYYTGTEEEWNTIEIDNWMSGNDHLLNADIHYNSTISFEVSVSSLIELNKALRTKKGAPKKFDLNGDKIINVIDLALLKRQLLGK